MLTLLNVGLLRLVAQDLVQLLLVGIAELGDIDLRLRIHDGVVWNAGETREWRNKWRQRVIN